MILKVLPETNLAGGEDEKKQLIVGWSTNHQTFSVSDKFVMKSCAKISTKGNWGCCENCPINFLSRTRDTPLFSWLVFRRRGVKDQSFIDKAALLSVRHTLTKTHAQTWMKHNYGRKYKFHQSTKQKSDIFKQARKHSLGPCKTKNVEERVGVNVWEIVAKPRKTLARQSVEQHSRVVIVFVVFFVFVVVANAMFENILHNQQKLWLINQLRSCSPKATALKNQRKLVDQINAALLPPKLKDGSR